MKWPGKTTYQQRVGLMRLMVPQLFDRPGRVLYVGAHKGRAEATLELWQAGHEIMLLEIWPEAIEGIRQSRFAKRFAHIVLGDVREVDTLDLSPFDFSVWLHGPEHVQHDELQPALTKLEELAKDTIIIACPWGRLPHGWKENPHNKHLSYWLPDDFARLGYCVACLGPKDKAGGQLLAWKETGKS